MGKENGMDPFHSHLLECEWAQRGLGKKRMKKGEEGEERLKNETKGGRGETESIHGFNGMGWMVKSDRR